MPIHPEVVTRRYFDDIEWTPLHSAHSKRSSEVFVDKDSLFLLKKKERKRGSVEREFNNLAFWSTLLREYREEVDIEISAPIPYLGRGDNLIMQYQQGVELDRLLAPLTLRDKDFAHAMRYVGSLLKIKKNEGLLHQDFDLRHLILHSGLSLVDIEKSCHGETSDVEEENDLLTTRLVNALGSVDPRPLIKEGAEAIPDLNLGTRALYATRNIFGKKVANAVAEIYQLDW